MARLFLTKNKRMAIPVKRTAIFFGIRSLWVCILLFSRGLKMYGYSRTYRTYLAALAGLCFALFSLSSVAQQVPPGQGVSVDWSPTTSHWQTNGSTFRTPPGVTTSSSTSVGPVTRTPTGGAAQPMGSGITITSIERTGPVSSILRTGPAALRTAVTRCFLNPVCTLTATAATIGLQELLDRTSWGIDDQGEVVSEELGPYPTDYEGAGIETGLLYGTTWSDCPAIGFPADTLEQGVPLVRSPTSESCSRVSGRNGFYGCLSERQDAGPLLGMNSEGRCFYGPAGGQPTITTPLTETEISDGIEQNYDFHPSDWPVIGPHIPLESADVEVEITNAPSLITPPKTTTVYDDNGQPHTITETNIDYSFTPRPGTNPGPRPAIDLETTETTTTYNPDGTSTGSSTTTTTRPAGDSTPASDPSMKIEFPGFCEWAPKLCGWLDWTQEGWDQEEPELPQIIDFEPEGDFQVGGPGDCPAPYIINLGWRLNQSIEVSYQPFCDLGVLIKPLFLAFCYLFAGVITVRSI